MLQYQYIPGEFTHGNAVLPVLNNINRTSKDFYFKAGNAPNYPWAIRLLNYLCLQKNIAIYIPRSENITRSTDVPYYLRMLTNATRVDVDGEYSYSLLYSPTQITSFNLKEVFAVHLIQITGQITDTFESKIPNWASANDAQELLGISLALKMSPKHRVRVFKRNNHIIIFATKIGTSMYENDYEFARKLWACIPLIREWDADEYAELINLFKSLSTPDATNFWNLLDAAYTNDPILKDIKYTNIISAFKQLAQGQINMFEAAVNNSNATIETALNQYNNALQAARDAQRRLAEAIQNKHEVDVPTIKLFVDKKIAYALDITRINYNGESQINYRCSAPLLNYDKDAAKAFYKRRIETSTQPYLKEIYTLMFIDEKVVLNFDEEININFSRGTFTARNGQLRHGNDYDKHFPNPHHAAYNCWGHYGNVITKLINQYSVEELFYQIKAAIGSLNFLDPPVMNNFLDTLYSICDGTYNPPCFLWKDENCTIEHTLNETINHFITQEDA